MDSEDDSEEMGDTIPPYNGELGSQQTNFLTDFYYKIGMRPARIKKGYGEIEFLAYDLASFLGKDARRVLSGHLAERTAVFPADHPNHQLQADRVAARTAWKTWRRQTAHPSDPAHPPLPPAAAEPNDIESLFTAIRLRFITNVSDAVDQLRSF